MSLINVQVSVNADQLSTQVRDGSIPAGNVNQPTNLGSYSSSDVFISMVAQDNVVANDQGKSELRINAVAGDAIRWSMTTLDDNARNTAFLYDGHFNPSTCITPLTYFNMHTKLYLPAGAEPKNGVIVEYDSYDYVAQGSIIEPGQTIQYTLSFKLIDNSNGQVIGYFTWDPFINVAQ
ncbi:AidA/PixA family protein [Shewanella sp. UCD-KL12]|uniref:AidA/PixA family protein n=1 Tax=Shewanella sp. UCD-KL12 TaxID=1917163 RepID=UPI000970CDAB|nr:AidA/PixA family protein [Shewanella sp. UCD-KL12]